MAKTDELLFGVKDWSSDDAGRYERNNKIVFTSHDKATAIEWTRQEAKFIRLQGASPYLTVVYLVPTRGTVYASYTREDGQRFREQGQLFQLSDYNGHDREWPENIDERLQAEIPEMYRINLT